MTDPRTPRRWRIGDLAAATGLTVRALHHYEQLGLLMPRRTDGNQRTYDEDDVRRLYRIRALREIGLSLEDVGRTLDDGRDLRDVLREHLARVEDEVRRRTDVRDRLRAVCARPDVPVGDLLGALEAMSRLTAHVARSGTAPDTAARWRSHGEALRACMTRGEPPESPDVRAVARTIREDLRAFAAGDPAVLAALARVRRDAPPAELAGWDPPLFAYLDRALSSLEDE